MPSITQTLTEEKLITPPGFVPYNVHYETIMGSVAYGVSDDLSDTDVYGFCIPPKDVIFPHLAGQINGFGRQIKRFDQYQQHHITRPSNGREYDVSIYNIVKYFQLCMENNPNMLDSLFTPQRCVVHCTKVGHLVRDNRRKFLHKGSWHKYKGYAYSQLHKMRGQKREGKRKILFDKYGYDVKFAYHVVRLLYEAQMILEECDLDLERNREHLKSIRRGEIPEQDIRDWASEKEKSLERLYETSKLPHSPDEEEIKSLLMHCLEEHYENLSDAIITEDRYKVAMRQVRDICNGLKEL